MGFFSGFFRRLRIRKTWNVRARQLDEMYMVMGEMAYEMALRNERYKREKCLTLHGHKGYSQNDEDGIIEEIFRRVGVTNKVFVEFGAADGLENNTTYLLMNGWTGFWIEGSKKIYDCMLSNVAAMLDKGAVKTLNSFITQENAVSLFRNMGVPKEFDLLSIDIDGNDYWIWKTLVPEYKPRVVVIEYNGVHGPSTQWVMKYDPTYASNSTTHFGASLKALELLGKEKGYALVGCNINGANAFFVREELLGDKFLAPYTAENHFEPQRFFRICRGGSRKVGEFVTG